MLNALYESYAEIDGNDIMIENKNITALFYELLRSSIGTPRPIQPPSAYDWSAMYDLAASHAVLGICFNGIQKWCDLYPECTINLPTALRMRWLGMAANIHKQNEFMNKRCAELYSTLSDCGLRSCVLKGQGITQFYPESLRGLRQSGDIDIWVEGKMKTTIEKINSIGIELADIHYVHATAKFFENVIVEVHFRPSWMYNPNSNLKLQTFFKEQSSTQFDLYDESVGFAYPSVYFSLVHSIVHINRHIFEEGIGIRQLIDLYFILMRSDTCVRKSSYSLLCSIGLKEFTAAVMYVEKEILAIDDSLLLCAPNVRLGSRLLKEIVEGGNFGNRLELKKGRNKIEKGYLQFRHNVKYYIPYINEVFWIPFFQLWHWCWRKLNGYL